MMHGTHNVVLTHCSMMHGTHVILTHCNMMHGTHNVILTHCNMMHGTHNVKLMLYHILIYTKIFRPLLPISTIRFTRIVIKYNNCPKCIIKPPNDTVNISSSRYVYKMSNYAVVTNRLHLRCY